MKLFFALQLPPPLHGSSHIGQKIKNIFEITEHRTKYLNISLSKSSTSLGVFRITKIFQYITILTKLFYCLISFRPDKIYYAPTISGFGFYKDFLNILFIKIFKKKKSMLIYHLHNRGNLNSINKYSANYFFYKYFFKNSKVILLSEKLYYDISNFVNISNIFVLPNGVEDNSINLSSSIKSNNIFYLGFLSNLIVSKGVFMLLDSLKEIIEKGYKFKLLLAGSEIEFSNKELLNYIKAKNLENYVEYLGPLYNLDKHLFFNKIHLFILPTFYKMECMPLVLIEAASYSLPLISTNIGAISDIVNEENGILINHLDSNSISKAILRYFENPSLIKLNGYKSRKIYLNNFSDQNFKEKVLKIILN